MPRHVRHRDESESEILAHLAAHPNSEDTLEGIVEWWLLERTIERGLRDVEGALEGLVASGLLERRSGAGAQPRYRLSEPRKQDVARVLAERRRAGKTKPRPERNGTET